MRCVVKVGGTYEHHIAFLIPTLVARINDVFCSAARTATLSCVRREETLPGGRVGLREETPPVGRVGRGGAGWPGGAGWVGQ